MDLYIYAHNACIQLFLKKTCVSVAEAQKFNDFGKLVLVEQSRKVGKKRNLLFLVIQCVLLRESYEISVKSPESLRDNLG